MQITIGLGFPQNGQQGAHDDLVALSGTLRTLAVLLYKIANDIRLMSCGPRAGFAELVIPENEPGSSIMPGKVNPTQAEALTMIAVQVMANDLAVGLGGAGGYLEMNVYKPLIIFNITHSIAILADGCTNFRKFLIEGTKPNRKKIGEYVERSLMLVTALSPVIGYDKASQIAHYALDNDLTLKQAALKLGFVTEDEFDRVVDPVKMVHPYVASTKLEGHASCQTTRKEVDMTNILKRKCCEPKLAGARNGSSSTSRNSGEPEEPCNERDLPSDVILRQPLYLSLPDHIHRLDTLNRSLCRVK